MIFLFNTMSSNSINPINNKLIKTRRENKRHTQIMKYFLTPLEFSKTYPFNILNKVPEKAFKVTHWRISFQ